MSGRVGFAGPGSIRCAHRATLALCLGPSGDDPSREATLNPSPGAVGPASRRWRRRYADAPAAALLTGLGAGEWSPLRSRPYAVSSV